MDKNKAMAIIHINKVKLGQSEDEYRDFLFKLTGKASGKDLNGKEAAVVIHEQNKLLHNNDYFATEDKLIKKIIMEWKDMEKCGVIKKGTPKTLNSFLLNKYKISLRDLEKGATENKTNLLEILKKWEQRYAKQKGH